MSKKTLQRTVMIMACAAAFTLVHAQFSWESPEPESPPAWSPSYEETPETGSSDDSPYNIGSSYSPSGDDQSGAATEPKTAQQPKAQRERASKSRPSGTPSAFAGPQKSCPVCTSVRLKGNLYAEYSGKKIHVCCAACIDRVRRNPAPFAAKLEKRGEQLAGM
ncbi:MAG: hypothetical protein FWC23_08440 [Chitinispirillia bacterium]|nr:hypothetical protein [Chitinispirillia bacterium]MCL2269196.1 hypothetical protein [Chitinispirillia bacterium]